MAEAPKRRKLEKTEPELPVSTQKFYCCRCGTAYSRQKGYFAVSHSPMYRGSGYLPMCNECVENMYDNYRKTLGGDREAMQRMCMKLDLYWSEKLYESVEKTAGVNSRIRNYIGKSNMVHYIDKTYDDTIKEQATFIPPVLNSISAEEVEEAEPEENEEIIIPQEIIDFWGSGFAPEFYLDLEKGYKRWTGGLHVDDPAEVALYKQICLLETTISRDSARGKPIDKNVGMLNTLLGSMNMRPAQKKDESESSLEKVPLGVMAKIIESKHPIAEPKDEFKDVDKIGEYISTWYFGHAGKMLGVKGLYSKLYDEAVSKLRVQHPEFEDEDDDSLLFDVFGGGTNDTR